MEIKEMIEVLQAYEDGKQIQYRNNESFSDKFKSVPSTGPLWDFYHNDYRAKPGPRVFYIVPPPNRDGTYYAGPCYEASQELDTDGLIKVREVIEDE